MWKRTIAGFSIRGGSGGSGCRSSPPLATREDAGSPSANSEILVRITDRRPEDLRPVVAVMVELQCRRRSRSTNPACRALVTGGACLIERRAILLERSAAHASMLCRLGLRQPGVRCDRLVLLAVLAWLLLRNITGIDCACSRACPIRSL